MYKARLRSLLKFVQLKMSGTEVTSIFGRFKLFFNIIATLLEAFITPGNEFFYPSHIPQFLQIGKIICCMVHHIPPQSPLIRVWIIDKLIKLAL